MLCSLYTVLQSITILTSYLNVSNRAILNDTQLVGIEVTYKNRGAPEETFLISKYPEVHNCFSKKIHPVPKRINHYLYCAKSPLHLSPGAWSAIEVKTSLKPSIVESCSNACRSGSRYFGIDSGIRCWCSRTLPIAKSVDKSLCMPCFDRKELSCGNVNYGMMSLYKILYGATRPSSPETFLKKRRRYKEKIVFPDLVNVTDSRSNLTDYNYNSDYNITDYGDYNITEYDYYNVTDYNSTDYSDYNSTDYTDYNSTDYSDYNSTDYTDYNSTDYTDYNSTDYSDYNSTDYTDYNSTDYTDYNSTDYSDYNSTDYSDYNSTDYSDYNSTDYSDYNSTDYSDYNSTDYSDYNSTDYSDYNSSTSQTTEQIRPTPLSPIAPSRRPINSTISNRTLPSKQPARRPVVPTLRNSTIGLAVLPKNYKPIGDTPGEKIMNVLHRRTEIVKRQDKFVNALIHRIIEYSTKHREIEEEDYDDEDNWDKDEDDD